MIDHNHFICHFIFGGHLLNIPKDSKEGRDVSSGKRIDLTKNLVVSPRKSLIIEF